MSNSLYKVETKTVSEAGLTFTYPNVTPADNGGSINILKDFTWKSTDGATDEVPFITLIEKVLTYGQWVSRIANAVLGTAGNALAGNEDPYMNLYAGSDTGFFYTFPYLVKEGGSIRGETRNEWKESTLLNLIGNTSTGGKLATKLSTGLKNIQGAGSLIGDIASPGYGPERIMTYAGTSPKSVNITFPLYNTNSQEKAVKNFHFVNLFGMQNLKVRTSFLTFTPPKIYEVDGWSSGGLYMPVAYVSNYNVTSIGTTRYLNGDGYDGYLLPEAYKVSITLTELIPESANIMMGATGDFGKVRVFTNV
jgi:hypothetical protein